MTARIFQPSKSAMTSGMARTTHWVLDPGPSAPGPIDPLMGWTGQTDTMDQVELRFPSKEAAIEYAEKNGLAYVVEEPNRRKKRPRGYGDNFAYNRRIAWTH